MSYREKKDSETWNQYLIKIFREGGGVNYMHFLDKYFNDERLAEYNEGKKLEKEQLEKNKIKQVIEESSGSTKTSFAKKPDRLKKKAKKGLLW